jgi:hypothetical protein
MGGNMKAVIPSYQFSVTLPVTIAYYLTCDSDITTCDSDILCDNSLGEIPTYKFSYTLDSFVTLTSDNTSVTCDNLITIDNG